MSRKYELMETIPEASFYDEPVTNLRIVGGESVIVNRYRWLASIQNDRTGAHFCGASLVGQRHLLSAKHCLLQTRTPVVAIGGTNLANSNEFVVRKVVRIIQHPATDVCVYELDAPVDGAKPVRVNSNDSLPVGTAVIAIGWGRTTERGPPSKILQQVTLQTVEQTTCARVNAKFNVRYELCAGTPGLTGAKDACAGDSGGPLIVARDPDDESTQVLVGVTSYGTGCARAQRAGVWVRTSAILDWLANIVPDLVSVDAIEAQQTAPEPPQTAPPLPVVQPLPPPVPVQPLPVQPPLQPPAPEAVQPVTYPYYYYYWPSQFRADEDAPWWLQFVFFAGVVLIIAIALMTVLRKRVYSERAMPRIG